MEDAPLEDVELVERAREGDVAAYGELVRRHQQVAVRVASFIVGFADAEDAAQEGFVKAYHALGRFRAGAPFRPWLLRIVSNEARNRRRSLGRRRELELRVAEENPSAVLAPSAEAAVLQRDERRALVEALGRLREPDRRILAYRYFLDLTEAEMAAVLRVPRGTVKSRLARALRRLREVMVSAGPDAPGSGTEMA